MANKSSPPAQDCEGDNDSAGEKKNRPSGRSADRSFPFDFPLSNGRYQIGSPSLPEQIVFNFSRAFETDRSSVDRIGIFNEPDIVSPA